jgi:hypothetical protein
MGGRPGLRVCPEVFRTVIMLMTVRDDSSVLIFLFFIFSFGCLCLVVINTAAKMFSALVLALPANPPPV